MGVDVADLDRRRRQSVCRACGAAIVVEGRYPSWCASCGWNIVTGTLAEELARHAKRNAKAEARADQLLAEALGGLAVESRPHRSVLGTIVAIAVHLVTVALLLGALVVAAWGRNLPTAIVGTILALLAIAVRPRFGKMPSGIVMEPARYPEFFALVEQVCDTLAVPPFDTIVITDAVNASTGTVGWRRRSVLTIGFALWNMLLPDERAALLAHEVAHRRNGDVRRSLLIGTAIGTLRSWYRVLSSDWSRPMVGPAAWAVLAFRLAVKQPLRAVVGALYAAELRLTLRDNRRAEYLADALSVRLAGERAALAALDKTYLLEAAADFVTRLARWQPEAPLWPSQLQFLARFPGSEWERLRRIGHRTPELATHSHPKIHRRQAFVRGMHAMPNQAVIATSVSPLSIADMSAIDAELRPVAAGIEGWIKRRAPSVPKGDG